MPSRLDRFPSDHALCAGLWVRADQSFVPQSLAIEADTAWVSGYDGGGPRGTLLCRVLRLDLRNGRVLDQAAPISGSVGGRPEVNCRHGGGLALTAAGLWLRRSFAVVDDSGLIGLGEFKFERRGRLDWIDPDALMSGAAIGLTAADAVHHQRGVPPMAQGAFWADLGSGPPGVWARPECTP